MSAILLLVAWFGAAAHAVTVKFCVEWNVGGHALFTAGNQDDQALFAESGAMDDCDPSYPGGHLMNSEEYQSAAANEGAAHFYAAATFNKVTETDCWFDMGVTAVDWNSNGTIVDPVDVAAFSCEGSPASGVDGNDYFGQYCGGGVLVNHGVEYDWLRMWWDLYTDEGFTVAQIMDIWDAANPDTWAEACDVYPNPCSAANSPAERLRAAAYTVGGQQMQDTYDDWALVHGTDW